jgi:hypothetical protein
MSERQADEDRGEPGDDTGRSDSEQDDPRGTTPSEEYRHADPRDLVSEDDVTMGGPGGAPQEGTSAEERRKRDRT